MSDLDHPVESGPSMPVELTEEERRERTEHLRRVPFGTRYLTEQDDVYSHNAWDHVVPPPEWEEEAKRKLEFHRQHKVDEFKKGELTTRRLGALLKDWSSQLQRPAGIFLGQVLHRQQSQVSLIAKQRRCAS